MLEEKVENSLLDNDSNNQAETDGAGESLLDNKQQNAFQVIQQKFNAEKSAREKTESEIIALKKELEDLKKGKTPEVITNDNKPADVNLVLKSLESKIDEKLNTITNQFKQQENTQKEQELVKILDAWGQKYGLKKQEQFRFVNSLNTSGTQFENSYEGRKQLLLSLVNNPRQIEWELNAVSPKSIEEALQRKANLQQKSVNKVNSAMPRTGQFNTQLDSSSLNEAKTFQEALEKYRQNKQKPSKLVLKNKIYK